MKTCEICGKEKPDITHEPSPNTLIFGPFTTLRGYMPTYQDRCTKCDKELGKKLLSMLKSDD